jgi:hypothetical protein
MATVCLSERAIDKACGNYTLGGLSQLWYANYSQYSGMTASADGTVTAMTMSGSSKFYEISFEDNQASFTNSLELSNGNKYIKQGINFKLGRKDALAIDIADDMNFGKFVFVAKDKLGNRYLLGRVSGLQVTISDLSSGTAFGDFGGWTFAAEGQEAATMAILSTSLTLPV